METVPLYAHERRHRISTLVEELGRVSVLDLSQRFGGSEVTIRKDLAWLEASERVLRTHGGALPANGQPAEYKFFEPALYHTDLADWGMAATLAARLGERALVLVDTGHHAAGTNVEHVVAFLLDERRLGGFHFNARRYADDDLIAGSTNPFELFCILHELRAAREDPELGPTARTVSTMIDQSHTIEPKVEAMVQSVVNVEVAHAKAQLVERPELRERQEAGDVLGAHRVLLRAFETDVRPLLAESRRRRGLDPDPIAAPARSGYAERMAAQRGKAEAGAGYPR